MRKPVQQHILLKNDFYICVNIEINKHYNNEYYKLLW